ncbi:MAG: DRTGG domain-containing protein [Chloroflexi bacterium]|nr:DRTGG domain-containing protein [Chloroflexota bacterium]
MSILYVVSDRPGAGKTAVCMALTKLLRAQSKSVVAIKPVADDADDSDAEMYASLLGVDTTGWPVAVAEDVRAGNLDEVSALINSLSAENDIVIVEGSTGLAGTLGRIVCDNVDAKVLVVAGYDASLSHGVVLTTGAPYGGRVIGYIINGVTQYMGTEARANLVPPIAAQASMRGARVLGLIPEDRCLLGVSVSQIMAHLDGELISEEMEEDALVEYLMVGGLSLDPGEYYYGIHDNRAAIVRGDRPDLQMSALSAPGLTACLVATGGIAPIEYVQYEAEQEETPIILVQTDTLDTMARLDNLLESSSFSHPDKLKRSVALLDEHVDVEGLLHAL